MAPIAKAVVPPACINHQMSDADIAAVIVERIALAEALPAGDQRQQVLADVSRLKGYLNMKQLLRPNGPRLVDHREVLSR
jgi:hypothetical protein